jgi:uncharacterized Tic20 family protein
MGTPGTPDPTSEPIEPTGSEGASSSEPPAPSYPDPTAAPAYGGTSGRPPDGALSPSDERTWATLGHVGGIIVGFLAPLVVWLVFRERSRFVDDQGKEALNFQIFLAIAYVVGWITTGFVIGFIILLAAWVLAVVFGIQGAIRANRGELYRYPLSWRVVK